MLDLILLTNTVTQLFVVLGGLNMMGGGNGKVCWKRVIGFKDQGKNIPKAWF